VRLLNRKDAESAKILTTYDPRAQSQERFSRFAQAYVDSATHAQGDDLERILALAAPEQDWTALDVATGGGHTALKIAPHVRQLIALDLAAPMLAAARTSIQPQVGNVAFVNAEAGMLPFRRDTFDLITCRIAPHHFPDCDRFVEECARALKPGGRLIVQDQSLPYDRRAARYIEAFERLRDPSHHRAYAPYEWEGMFLNAGLRVTAVEAARKRASLVAWAQVQECTPQVIEHLQIMLVQAPAAVTDQLQPRCAGSADASFDHVYVIIAGIKP
jgi:ubiquinone/menaquinone biosynthesis C-methylase UbiE